MKRGGPMRRRAPLTRSRTTRTDRPRPGLSQARKFVEGRANGRCEAHIAPDCRRRGTQAHHLLMRSQGGTDDPGNLIWICAPCHDHVHARPAESYDLGLLRRRTG